MTRQEKDHARYLREREQRLIRAREYYKENRDSILQKKRKRLMREWARRIEDNRNYGENE